MKAFLLLFCFCLFSVAEGVAQSADFHIKDINLPVEIAEPENQVSGLYIYGGQLYFLTECRLQDKRDAKLFSIALRDLDKKMKDTAFKLPFTVIPILNLDVLRKKINDAGPLYEGLEAIIIKNGKVFLSVETATPSDDCFILEGEFREGRVVLNTENWRVLPKPLLPNGKKVYNAGFEAMALINGDLHAFFEYNYEPMQIKKYWAGAPMNKGRITYTRVPDLPFRLTDVTAHKGKLIGINFFFKGDGGDEVYRVGAADSNYKLINNGIEFQNYCRLISIDPQNDYAQKTLWEFPADLRSYNWEGIAAYREGFFIVNDKYTPARPYRTKLVYLAPVR